MFRFAIVGCGRIAKRHTDLLGNRLRRSLCAVCDVKKVRIFFEKIWRT